MTDEKRAERLRYHMYESCEGIREHAERIVALEELVHDMYLFMALVEGLDVLRISARGKGTLSEQAFEDRMAALGIEVKS